MSVKIRLKQIGKRDQRGYRIVAIDEHKKRDGKVLETIGFTKPGGKTEVVKIDNERLNYWLGVGAQLSDGARKLLKK